MVTKRNPIIEKALKRGFKSGGDIGDIGGGTRAPVSSSGGGVGGTGSYTRTEARLVGGRELEKQFVVHEQVERIKQKYAERQDSRLKRLRTNIQKSLLQRQGFNVTERSGALYGIRQRDNAKVLISPSGNVVDSRVKMARMQNKSYQQKVKAVRENAKLSPAYARAIMPKMIVERAKAPYLPYPTYVRQAYKVPSENSLAIQDKLRLMYPSKIALEDYTANKLASKLRGTGDKYVDGLINEYRKLDNEEKAFDARIAARQGYLKKLPFLGGDNIIQKIVRTAIYYPTSQIDSIKRAYITGQELGVTTRLLFSGTTGREYMKRGAGPAIPQTGSQVLNTFKRIVTTPEGATEFVLDVLVMRNLLKHGGSIKNLGSFLKSPKTIKNTLKSTSMKLKSGAKQLPAGAAKTQMNAVSRKLQILANNRNFIGRVVKRGIARWEKIQSGSGRIGQGIRNLKGLPKKLLDKRSTKIAMANEYIRKIKMNKEAIQNYKKYTPESLKNWNQDSGSAIPVSSILRMVRKKINKVKLENRELTGKIRRLGITEVGQLLLSKNITLKSVSAGMKNISRGLGKKLSNYIKKGYVKIKGKRVLSITAKKPVLDLISRLKYKYKVAKSRTATKYKVANLRTARRLGGISLKTRLQLSRLINRLNKKFTQPIANKIQRIAQKAGVKIRISKILLRHDIKTHVARIKGYAGRIRGKISNKLIPRKSIRFIKARLSIGKRRLLSNTNKVVSELGRKLRVRGYRITVKYYLTKKGINRLSRAKLSKIKNAITGSKSVNQLKKIVRYIDNNLPVKIRMFTKKGVKPTSNIFTKQSGRRWRTSQKRMFRKNTEQNIKRAIHEGRYSGVTVASTRNVRRLFRKYLMKHPDKAQQYYGKQLTESGKIAFTKKGESEAANALLKKAREEVNARKSSTVQQMFNKAESATGQSTKVLLKPPMTKQKVSAYEKKIKDIPKSKSPKQAMQKARAIKASLGNQMQQLVLLVKTKLKNPRVKGAAKQQMKAVYALGDATTLQIGKLRSRFNTGIFSLSRQAQGLRPMPPIPEQKQKPQTKMIQEPIVDQKQDQKILPVVIPDQRVDVLSKQGQMTIINTIVGLAAGTMFIRYGGQRLRVPQSIQKGGIRSIRKWIWNKLNKRSYYYTADIFSIIFGIRAKGRQRIMLIKKGRTFTGLERRAMV